MRTDKIFYALILSFSLLTHQPAWAIERTLYSIVPNSGAFRIINGLNGATITTKFMNLSGTTPIGGRGLARDPTTGKLWALLRMPGAATCQGGLGGYKPTLVTINPTTFLATAPVTSVGVTTDCFVALAFTANGTLYAVTGDGADDPEALYTLNKTNASASKVRDLGAGTGGEALGFNPTNGLLYHASGFAVKIFESINPGAGHALTNIPLSGDSPDEMSALTHRNGNVLLLAGGCNLGCDNELFTVTTGGVISKLGNLDHVSKGLAFMPKQPTDFDGDAETDPTVYQTATGHWFAVRSTGGFGQQLAFGGAGFIPVPGDYDGDGRTDPAVYETATGNWFINQTTSGIRIHPSFGGAGFISVPGDYDGDGKIDVAVYQQATGHWFYVGSTSGFGQQLGFGGAGYIPVPGDYDGDGRTDPAVYQQATGHWFFVGSTSGFGQQLAFGGAGYIPVPGDYDGDGRTDPAVHQQATGHWFFVRSTAGFGQHLGFGGAGFIPVPGDYDRDGRTDTAVYDTTNGNWFMNRSTLGIRVQPAFGGFGYDPVGPQFSILKALGIL